MSKTIEQSAETVGVVDAVENHGTIVLVVLKTDGKKWIPIYFDHRPFGWLVADLGCRPDELVGRRIAYDGETVRFLD